MLAPPFHCALVPAYLRPGACKTGLPRQQRSPSRRFCRALATSAPAAPSAPVTALTAQFVCPNYKTQVCSQTSARFLWRHQETCHAVIQLASARQRRQPSVPALPMCPMHQWRRQQRSGPCLHLPRLPAPLHAHCTTAAMCPRHACQAPAVHAVHVSVYSVTAGC